MNQTELHNNSDGENTTVDQKPCFVTSSALVFTNLHKAAVEKAARVIGVSPGGKTINEFFINTGLTDDGRTVTDDLNSTNTKYRFAGTEFEVGIVMQVQDVKDPSLLDDASEQAKVKSENKKLIEDTKKKIFEGLKEYFKWFSGSADFQIGDLTEFTPDYNGGKVQIKDGQILGKKNPKKTKDSEKFRIGYKIGYTVEY